MLRVASRELTWGLRSVGTEVERWRQRAQYIQHDRIRYEALAALCRKRPHLDGAALFSALPVRRNIALLRALVSYEIILEFLDNLNERFADFGLDNARQLHLALVQAVDIDSSICDYYSHMQPCDDGGFLHELVKACRTSCQALADYAAVRPLLVREAQRATVLALNHEPNATRRDTILREWATEQYGERADYSLFELTGAATSSLTVHMLLSQAAISRDRHSTEQAYLAYFPAVALLSTMLDSYVDDAADFNAEHHRYIGHYKTDRQAVRRLRQLIYNSFASVRDLPQGHRHKVIVAAMIAMYLSADNARLGPRRSDTAQLARAGGLLTRLLIPILRLWRIMYRLRSA